MGTLKGAYRVCHFNVRGFCRVRNALPVRISEISLQPLLHLHSDIRTYLQLVTAGLP